MHENYGWTSFRLLEGYTHHRDTATRRAGENVSRLTRVGGTRMSTATKIRSSRESRRVLVGVKRATEGVLQSDVKAHRLAREWGVQHPREPQKERRMLFLAHVIATIRVPVRQV